MKNSHRIARLQLRKSVAANFSSNGKPPSICGRKVPGSFKKPLPLGKKHKHG